MLDQALQQARAHLDARRLAEAEHICREVLRQVPEEPEALRLLGLAAYFAGDFAAAESWLRRLMARVAPTVAHHNNLSVVLWRLRRGPEAEAEARRALSLDPTDASAWNHLGNALQLQQRYAEAVQAYTTLLAAHPDHVAAWSNLGAALQSAGRNAESAAAYRRAIELQPDFADAWTNYGSVLEALGQPTEALAAHQQALRLAPQSPPAHLNLSFTLLTLQRWHEAEAACRQALALQPRYPKALCNMAAALASQERYAEAEDAARQALAFDPGMPEAGTRLGNILMGQGRAEEALAIHRQAVDIAPHNAAVHSSALCCEHYVPGVTLAHLAAVHAQWQERHAATWTIGRVAWPNPRDPHRPLRLGFLSADLGTHPVGFFVVGLIEHLDRRQAHVTCYNDRRQPDAVNSRFRAAADAWRDVKSASDEELLRQIRGDQIDILFDLAGHTSQRLLVFARRAAPLQMTWIGYVGTTGLEAMDYLVADRHQVLAGTETHYRENILCLPDGYVCFDPPAEAPAVGPLPAQRNGYVTFGSFNNPVKYNRLVIARWAKILRRVPESRLTLKFDGVNEPSVRGRFTDAFAAHGVAAARLQLLGKSPRAELLEQYNHIDLALDPFPYGGGLTTCEALWMGVPVITCPGETFASRHALGHLSNVGLTETIARDAQHYVELAVKLASDLPRLAALRSGLRQRVAASPLCDPQRFAAGMLTALRQAWREWLAGASQDRRGGSS